MEAYSGGELAYTRPCSVVSESLRVHGTVACLPGSFVHGIFQATKLEWVAISFSRGSSQPRNLTQISCVSCIVRRILNHCTTREAHSSGICVFFFFFALIKKFLFSVNYFQLVYRLFFLFFSFIYLFYFTILYWFCHTLT